MTDNRILIRLQPHQIRRIHRILRAIVERRGYATMLDLTRDDVEAARDLLERIPNIVPQQSAIRNPKSAIE